MLYKLFRSLKLIPYEPTEKEIQEELNRMHWEQRVFGRILLERERPLKYPPEASLPYVNLLPYKDVREPDK
jgi:hypothetical protein